LFSNTRHWRIARIFDWGAQTGKIMWRYFGEVFRYHNCDTS